MTNACPVQVIAGDNLGGGEGQSEMCPLGLSSVIERIVSGIHKLLELPNGLFVSRFGLAVRR